MTYDLKSYEYSYENFTSAQLYFSLGGTRDLTKLCSLFFPGEAFKGMILTVRYSIYVLFDEVYMYVDKWNESHCIRYGNVLLCLNKK